MLNIALDIINREYVIIDNNCSNSVIYFDLDKIEKNIDKLISLNCIENTYMYKEISELEPYEFIHDYEYPNNIIWGAFIIEMNRYRFKYPNFMYIIPSTDKDVIKYSNPVVIPDNHVYNLRPKDVAVLFLQFMALSSMKKYRLLCNFQIVKLETPMIIEYKTYEGNYMYLKSRNILVVKQIEGFDIDIKNSDDEIINMSYTNFTKAKSFIHGLRNLSKILNMSNSRNRDIISGLWSETLSDYSMSEIFINAVASSDSDDISFLENFTSFKPNISDEYIDPNYQALIFVRKMYNIAIQNYLSNSEQNMSDFLSIEVPNYSDVYRGVYHNET